MKQRSPVHFVVGFFEAIAPYAQRMRRKTERCGILGMPHAAPVHRFDMRAPESAKSNRTAIATHAVAIARGFLSRFGWPFFGFHPSSSPNNFCKFSARLCRSS